MRAGAYQVPRPETYVRDLGTPKRRGCQNSILDARSLRRGLHPPHLHSRYEAEAGQSRTNDGQLHGASDVSRKRMRNTGEGAKPSLRYSLNLSAHFPVWVTVWVRQLTHILTHTISGVFATKKHRKPKFSMLFGAGGVTRTHDLLITNYDSFVLPISVNARKVLCRKAFRIFAFCGISLI